MSTVPLASDLTTRAQLEAALGCAHDEPRTQFFVSAASDAVRSFLGRPRLHYERDRQEWKPLLLSERFVLDVVPVRSVDELKVYNEIVEATGYYVEYPLAGVVFVDRSVWSSAIRRTTLQVDLMPGTERRAMQVKYTAGWVTPAQAESPGWTGPPRDLPFDLEQAVISVASKLRSQAGRDTDVRGEALGSYSVQYGAAFAGRTESDFLGEQAISLLQPYRMLA